MYIDPKIKKTILFSIIGGLAILGVIIYITTALEDMSPKAIAEQKELEKMEWGYQQRISELSEIRGFQKEYEAKRIIDFLISDEIGIPKITSIEQGGDKGNISFNTEFYKLDVLLRGDEVHNIWIGKTPIYRKLKLDDAQLIKERLYSFKQYNIIVENLSKQIKISKKQAAQLFLDLTDIDIHDLNKVEQKKKFGIFKVDNVYTVESYSIPLELTIINGLLEQVIIPQIGKVVPKKVVYVRNSGVENQTIKDHTLLNMRRSNIPNALAYQVETVFDDNSTIRFPVALSTGEDSWCIIKIADDTYYFEVKTDITNNQGNTKSSNLKIVRNGESSIIYLERDGDIIVE